MGYAESNKKNLPPVSARLRVVRPASQAHVASSSRQGRPCVISIIGNIYNTQLIVLSIRNRARPFIVAAVGGRSRRPPFDLASWPDLIWSTPGHDEQRWARRALFHALALAFVTATMIFAVIVGYASETSDDSPRS